jgi:hypothetical protein
MTWTQLTVYCWRNHDFHSVEYLLQTSCSHFLLRRFSTFILGRDNSHRSAHLVIYANIRSAFASLWPLYLATPPSSRFSPPASHFQYNNSPMEASGGLNMPAETVGIAMAVLGASGVIQQLLFYPPVQARLGSVRCYQYFSFIFPLGYFSLPGLLLLPQGAVRWGGVAVISCLLVTARTFTLPATIVLLNNCTPHPSVLGTVHGLGQSISAGFRTIGPIVGGYWFSHSLLHGATRESWWLVAFVACIGWLTTFMVREGSGHEIHLPGDDKEFQ